MKRLKILMVIAVLISAGIFSWNYYAGRAGQDKHERALLVFEAGEAGLETTLPGRLYTL